MKKFKFILAFVFMCINITNAQLTGVKPGYNFYPAYENGKYGYINSTGQWLIKPKFDKCGFFYNGRAVIKEKMKFGFIDSRGAFIGKPDFDTVSNFSEGIAAVAHKNDEGVLTWGLIDTSGSSIKLNFPALSAISTFSCGRAIASENGFLNFFFFNRKGEIAFEAKDFYLDENRISGFSENMLHVYIEDGSSSFIDTSGILWGKGHYENCGDFHEGMAWIQSNGKYGFVNIDGEIIIPAMYDSVGDFSEGIVMVKTDMKYDPEIVKITGGKVSYINKKGEKITPAIYSEGTAFSDGFAFVKFNGLYGFIDRDGKVVIDYQFERGNNFFRGLAYVKKENHWEYINTNGNKVW